MNRVNNTWRYSIGIFNIFILICFFGLYSQAQAEELKIGLVTGLTGSTATWGKDISTMANLIGEEINAAGGFKVKGGKIKVVIKSYDSESNAEVGGAVTERAISDGCRIIIPGAQSAVGFTSSERSERAKILCIDPYDTAEKLTERGFKYYFRVCASSVVTVRESNKYLLWQEKRTGVKMKNVAIFATDNVTGRSKGDQLAEQIPKMAPHWNIYKKVFYPPKTSDFTVFLNEFKQKNIDILLGDQYPTEAILVTRQCREIDYNPISIHGMGGGQMEFEYATNLKWMALGTTNTCYFSPFCDKIRGLSALNEKYKKRYGTDISQISSDAAVVLTLVKDIVERAGSIEVEAMRQALVNTDLTRLEYKEGESWWIQPYGAKFDEKGQNIKATNPTIVWVSPTRYEITYPEEFATTVAPWPKLTWEEQEKKYASVYPIGRK
jgi:branched-chain amino acid transport system substrate-binding protein